LVFRIRPSLTGAYSIIGSALALALGSMCAKVANFHGIPPIEVALARFAVGFFILNVMLIIHPRSIRPVNPRWVMLRSIFTVMAIITFFIGISSTTLVNANLLNMTYPIFVALIAPFWNKEPFTYTKVIAITMAMTGIYFVIRPEINFCVGDIWALISGVLAGGGISSLREARATDSSFTILYYLMTIGMGVTLIGWPGFVVPDIRFFGLLILIGVLTFAGQYLLTYGYRYVKALDGSILSTSRIVFAGVLGISMFAEVLSWSLLLGTAMITCAIIWIQTQSSKKDGKEKEIPR